MRMSRNREMSYATSLSSALQQVSLSIGVAFGAFVLEIAASLDGDAAITAADFAPAFWAVAVISALSGFVFVAPHARRRRRDVGAQDCEGKTAFDRPGRRYVRRWTALRTAA